MKTICNLHENHLTLNRLLPYKFDTHQHLYYKSFCYISN